MKINILSDIHLESYPLAEITFDGDTVSPNKFEDLFPGVWNCDTLVLAGDIVTSPKMLADLVQYAPIPVVYVLGNHEYYGLRWENTAELYQSELGKTSMGITLSQRSLVLGDIHFIGATLWTDFNKNDPLVVFDAARRIADFRRIAGCTTEKMRERFLKDKAFLENELKENFFPKDRTVVVTHFAPSYLSQHRAFSPGGVGYYFVSDLEDLILRHQPALWIHGHTHDSCDYRIGSTRMVSCQPGYEWEARGRKNTPLSIVL